MPVAVSDKSLIQLVQGRDAVDRATAAQLLERVFAEAHAAPCDLNPANIHLASDGQAWRVMPLARGRLDDDADIWTLGTLTFFVLTGEMYGRAPAERALGMQPGTRRAAELGVEAALPAGFDAWFARTVSRDSKQRFRDAAEAWHALCPLLGGSAPAPVTTRPSVVVRPSLFITLVISSVVGAGLVIYWLLRSMHI